MASVIPAVTKLSSRVIRILGCNPGHMTLQGTNTYLLGTGKRRILVDTGDDDVPQYITHLRHVLKHEDCNLEHIIITHWHHDHIGGLKNVMETQKNCKVWKYPRTESAELSEDIKIEMLKDKQEISVEGATVKVVHTPGHTTDHIVLMLAEENAILSGDCVLGEGTAVFEDLYEYMKSLNIILKLNPDIIYPGHGNVIQILAGVRISKSIKPWCDEFLILMQFLLNSQNVLVSVSNNSNVSLREIALELGIHHTTALKILNKQDPLKKIQFYIDHRNERENQILDVLRNNSHDSFTEMELVKIIYTEVTPKYFEAAAYNVNHHLVKLMKENQVEKINGKWKYLLV